MKKYYCSDCEKNSLYHLNTWSDEIIESFLPKLHFLKNFNSWFDLIFEKIFSSLGLIKMEDDFSLSRISSTSACFIAEGKIQGIKFKAAKGPFGYTGHFYAELNNKKFRFERLPLAEHKSKYDTSFTDCKKRTRLHLKKGNFPFVAGKSFWFWQKNKAYKFGINNLKFPLVVKPRNGSVSRHVTTNIKNEKELLKAINKSLHYSPVFIVEKYIENSFVYRATVVDFNHMAIIQQIPANIIGDGNLTIQELIDNKKHNTPNQHQLNSILRELIINNTTNNILAEKKYTLQTIPQKNEIVYLQIDPFLKLGGDLIDVTNKVHPDNIKLFTEIAKFFDIYLVGIDFMIPNISDSWQNQSCAILELNSVPSIEMHHFPSSGEPQNIAKHIVDLCFKYYL